MGGYRINKLLIKNKNDMNKKDLEAQRISKIADSFTDTFLETITLYIDIYFGYDLTEEENSRIYDLILQDVKKNYFDRLSFTTSKE